MKLAEALQKRTQPRRKKSTPTLPRSFGIATDSVIGSSPFLRLMFSNVTKV